MAVSVRRGHSSGPIATTNRSLMPQTEYVTYTAPGLSGDYSADSIYNTLAKQSEGISAGGYMSAYRPDTSASIAAYNQAANANRQAAESNYNTTRSDLLNSLKRYQESNAKDVANQRQSYLTGQSNLESAKEMANRQSKISNASRGIGGSGLQQLAEIQNELGTQQDESLLANQNQSTMDALKLALKNYTEDTNRGIDNAYNVYQNALRGIDADLAAQIARVNYDADQAYNNSLAQASMYNNNLDRSIRTENLVNANILSNELTGYIKTLKSNLSKMSADDLKKEYGATSKSNKDIMAAIRKQSNAYLDSLSKEYGLTSNLYNSSYNDIQKLIDAYKNVGNKK